VLYVDGEMGTRAIAGRLDAIARPDTRTGDLRFLTFEDTGGTIPNLATVEGQQTIEKASLGTNVFIFDHYSACVRAVGRELEVDAWARTQDWLIKLRANGASAIIVHHAGKSGQQRGTSRIEDALDYTMSLKAPLAAEQGSGCCFDLVWEKTRHFFGEEARSQHVRMFSSELPLAWLYEDQDEAMKARIRRMGEKLSVQEIVHKTGLGLAYVKSLIRECDAPAVNTDEEDLF
jgi:putative DNA primase/helicase